MKLLNQAKTSSALTGNSYSKSTNQKSLKLHYDFI